MNDKIFKTYWQCLKHLLVLAGYILIVSAVFSTLYMFILIFH